MLLGNSQLTSMFQSHCLLLKFSLHILLLIFKIFHDLSPAELNFHFLHMSSCAMYLIDCDLLIISKCKLKMSAAGALVICSLGLEILCLGYWISSSVAVLKNSMIIQPVSQVFQAAWQNCEVSSSVAGLLLFFPSLCNALWFSSWKVLYKCMLNS